MSAVLEYLFYTEQQASLFTNYLDKYQVPWQQAIEPIQDAMVVNIKEADIGDLWDQVDDFYDQLEAQEIDILDQDPGNDDISAAGLHLQLASGQFTIAKVNPAILKRIMTVLSNQELTEFLDAVVDSVENPDDTPICKTSC